MQRITFLLLCLLMGCSPEELYDHENDSQEWINLAGDPQLLEIKTQLKDWVPKKVQPSIPFTRIH